MVATSDEVTSDVSEVLLVQPGLLEDFFTAFPMALPTRLVAPDVLAEPSSVWHRPEMSSSSSLSSETSYAQSDANPRTLSYNLPISVSCAPGSPGLPSPCDSVGSSILSPRSDQFFASTPQRPPSASGNTTGTSDASNAIRAAYHASVRKKKSLNRNSWNPMSYTDTGPSPSPMSPRLQDSGLLSPHVPVRTVSLDP